MRMMTENVLFKRRKSIYSWVGYFLDFCSTSGVTFHSSNNKKKNNNYCPAHATILKFFIARIQQRKSSPPSCFLPPYNQGCIWPSSCPDASSRSSAPARRRPVWSPSPRSQFSSSIWFQKELGTALERARRAEFKSALSQARSFLGVRGVFTRRSLYRLARGTDSSRWRKCGKHLPTEMATSTRKRKESDHVDDGTDDVNDGPSIIRDITASVLPPATKDKYVVMYTVTFTKPCCDNHSKAKQIRIRIHSEVAFFNKDAETWSLMMDKTKTAIRKHKREVSHGGLDLCNLDYKSGIGGVYMSNNESSRSLWKLVYTSAENDINKLQLKKYEKSQMQVKQHKKKFDELMLADWVVGEEFNNKMAKYTVNVMLYAVVMSVMTSAMIDLPCSISPTKSSFSSSST